jgi:hypothetical protein
MPKRLIYSILLLFMCFPSILEALPQTSTKRKVLSDLDCIQSIFEVKYAPKSWKQQFAGWELHRAIEEAKNRISQLSNPSLKECQVILRDFFNSTKDYHVGVRFYSTESSSLPFLIKGSSQRYFVSFVDREQLSKKEFPFDEGDEILSFGSRPIHEVVQELRVKEFGSNTFETDHALAELSLTHRRGDLGHLVPSGSVEITGIRKGFSKPLTVNLSWQYTPERIRDFSKIGKMTGSQMIEIRSSHENLTEVLKKSSFFEKMMLSHFWDNSYVGGFTEPNKHALGARSSFIPALGRKIWQSDYETVFDAYIFLTPSGKSVGYIRIPHYVADEEESEEFGQIMNFFQKRTDALIIDQVNNPGGSVFYLYALASMLTDKPLYTPKHHIAMTQEEVHIACSLIPFLEQVSSDESARIIIGDTLGGYPVDFRFAKLMKSFCHFLISQWEKGNLLSDPTFLFGVDEVQPHPAYRYTKPILLLVNSLDFSGGDFFPAIMQDNKRAIILGTRTAGAGGYVLSLHYPNHSGIKGFVMTGSLAERIDHKPIENLGITPDIHYELSAEDLQENYHMYVAKILETIDSMVKKQ